MLGDVLNTVSLAVITCSAIPSAGNKSAKIEVGAITAFSMILLDHGLSLRHPSHQGEGVMLLHVVPLRFPYTALRHSYGYTVRLKTS